MTTRVYFCRQQDRLVDVAQLMADYSDETLPVLATDVGGQVGAVLGMITKTDIALAGEANENLSELRVFDVATREVPAVCPSDSVEAAEALMREHGVRRLPVLDGGDIVGTISLCDIVGAAYGWGARASGGDLLLTLAAICAPPPPRRPGTEG